MNTAIEFFFDLVSPYSYLASEKIEELAKQNNRELIWKPFLLGGLFKALDAPPAPGLLPYKKPYLFKDLDRLARFHGIPFNTPSEFPRLTVKPLRALLSLPKEDLPEAVHQLYRAYWVEDRDISDASVLADLLGAEAIEKTGDPEIKQSLIQATDEAVSRGLFGAPTFLVGQEMFFGHDRMDLLEAFLQDRL
ncbi:MAG TPA: 2-hydroxychromene-2-carboxylate isomerase [SAR324 cluster bacterium]|jgi:2-hydroxychromene-2-carboxylate isomerase|nr:2-hydroxychromene-2-carboxylate isomerase [SAR324 cluster bacterium]MDP6464143.1 2-hydroxychromene-2-carboxylate isomerase [SAR324 cluster bacterium]MDP6728905.1 2-hydroxychromene-2-carboxylate isomerase [SAR324 cluster bacterium]MDP7333185.1 2-hydroxychromene-2-carboxylate isomerase [SAR324 cluster bacterium]HJO44250.1 2-hydroxychromene-2-carboxylate isomerase [SAR324 cluster bacterium]|tara:strand:+ start:335 stop:910 length:576 start_codon:yes stop_codon:yes gene_type:complete